MASIARRWLKRLGWGGAAVAPRTRSNSAAPVDRRLEDRRRLHLELLEERTPLAIDVVSASILGGTAQRASSNPTISNDGRYVVFESTANDLVFNDTNAATIVDIFRRDTVTGVTQLVSINIGNSGGGNGSSSAPVISSDGRYVAFVSTATDLQTPVPDSNGAGADIFLRDMINGTTVVISRSVTGTTANAPSSAPVISDDGRFVAFQSTANNFVTPGIDANNVSDIFVYDRTTTGITLLSVAFNTPNAGNGASGTPVISGNGTIVAWTSTASNLAPLDTNGAVQDVFARAVTAGTTQLLTVSRTGGSGNGSSALPSISTDGRYVAFTSLANDLVTNDTNGVQDVYVRDRNAATATLVSLDLNNAFSAAGASDAPIISAGGQFVAFTSIAGNLTINDTNGVVQDVFRRDILNNITQLVSQQFSVNGSGNGASAEPVISLDGRYVGFSSVASNLVSIDSNGTVRDVFRRDMALVTTTLLSFTANGIGSGNGASNDPTISDDGFSVAFASVAANLNNTDTNGPIQDIFLFASSNQIVVTAPNMPGGPHVRVFDARNLSVKYEFFAYGAGFTGGVRVATADVNNDTIPDIITAPGPGGGPHVRVFNGAAPGQTLTSPIGNFFAYGAGFTGGVFVAAAYIDGDAFADIITGADAGGGPHVKVFSGATGAQIASFFAYSPSYTGGARVAAGDVNGDGFRDIIVSSGTGMVSNYTVFSGATNFTSILATVSPYGAFGGGVYVSAGDINGDGRADVVTGAGPGGGPHVRGFSGLDNSLLVSFFAYASNFTGGVRVGTSDADSNGRVDILTANGPGTTTSVRVFAGATGAFRNEVLPYNLFTGGAFTAGSKIASSGGSPLLAAPDDSIGSQAPVDVAALAPSIAAAIDRYANAGLSAASLARLQATPVVVADLPGDLLGVAQNDRVLIDFDAAGRSWFVDSTPGDDAEFALSASGGLIAAKGPAATRIDLLTVLVHELGHVLGLDDLDPSHLPDDVMSGLLGRGVRRLPTTADLDNIFAGL